MVLNRKELIVKTTKQLQILANMRKEQHDNKIQPVVFKIWDLVTVKNDSIFLEMKSSV